MDKAGRSDSKFDLTHKNLVSTIYIASCFKKHINITNNLQQIKDRINYYIPIECRYLI